MRQLVRRSLLLTVPVIVRGQQLHVSMRVVRHVFNPLDGAGGIRCREPSHVGRAFMNGGAPLRVLGAVLLVGVWRFPEGLAAGVVLYLVADLKRLQAAAKNLVSLRLLR